MSGRIVQISVSGGVPKPRATSARVTVLEGLEDDGHRDLEHHGGPERVVCLDAMEAIRALQSEGSTIVPRSHLLLGESVCLQVTKYTNPCVNIAPAFQDENSARVSQKRNPGWRRVDARVLATGSIRASDRVWLPTDAEAARMRVPART